MVERIYSLSAGVRLFALLLFVFLILSWLTVRDQEQDEFNHYIHELTLRLNLVTDNFADMQNITAFQLAALQQQIRSPGQADQQQFQPQNFKDHFTEVMEANPDYSQIRFLDQGGHEAIRLQREDGQLVVVSNSELQDKSGRTYFIVSSKLPEGQVYVSSIDPNIEHGALVQPVEPTIRVAMPVYESGGALRGVLVVNRSIRQLHSLLADSIAQDYSEARVIAGNGVWKLMPGTAEKYQFLAAQAAAENIEDQHSHEGFGDSEHSHEGFGSYSTPDGTWLWSAIDPLKDGQSVFAGLTGVGDSSRLEILIDPAVRERIRREALAFWLPINFVLVALLGLLLWQLRRMRFRNKQIRQDLRQSQQLLDAKQRAHEAEQQYRLMIESNINGVLTADEQGIIQQTNAALDCMFGYGRGELIGEPVEILVDPDVASAHVKQRNYFMDIAVGTSRMSQRVVQARRKDGTHIPVDISLSVLEQGERKPVAATVIDLSERIRTEKRLADLMHYDELTGLPNRLFAINKLDVSIESARTNNWSFACIYLDLDLFKNINESLGHEAGDALLVAVARRLKSLLGENDVLARLTGDKFLIITHSFNKFEHLSDLLSRLMQSFSSGFTLADQEVPVKASVGVSAFPGDGESTSALLRAAEVAMYEAKKSGRNNYCFHSSALTEEVQDRTRLELDLAAALDRGELYLHYQPQFDTREDRLIGFEALLRWRHAELGHISPAKFIPLAESSGLIHDIGEWVMHEACRQASEWLGQGLEFEHISVNVSGVQLQRNRLLAQVSSALAAAGLPENKLELELTESFVMSQQESVIADLEQIRRLGVALSIDDFGTGYSSLAYLKRLPIQKIKIDKSFIMDIPADQNDVAITRAIIAMADSMRLQIIAEGVETGEQKQFLMDNGCTQVQGYLYSKPLTPQQVGERFLSG